MIEIDAAGPEHHAILANLWELYAYDMSPFVTLNVDPTGRFPARSFAAYGRDPLRHAFLFRSKGNLAGFALVHRGSKLSGDPDVYDVAEFFVLQLHRRTGVGSAAAEKLFRQFPGKWEVRPLAANPSAIRFWQSVVGRLTSGRFEDLTVERGPWQGHVLSFTTTDLPPPASPSLDR